jgi:hypothetical protein
MLFCFCGFTYCYICGCFRSIARPYYLLFIYFATLSFLPFDDLFLLMLGEEIKNWREGYYVL